MIDAKKTEEKFLKYANSFQTVSKLDLKRIGMLMEILGNPQDKLSYVHIAGTNGKGSVSAFLQCILTKSNMKVGKYISPNMIKVNERISIDGVDIGDEELQKLLLKVEKACDETDKRINEYPTQFEIWTAVAFVYFYENKCDMVVLETGLGGRFDATNIIKTPKISILTKIDYDHMIYLGNTIEKIAFEKCGIIKKNTTVITTFSQKVNAKNVIEEISNNRNCDLIYTKPPLENEFSEIYEIISYKDIQNVKLSLGGVHQIENACLAIDCAKQLQISSKDISYGLENAKNAGRFESILDDDENIMIFDGAHNKNGVEALKKSLIRYFKGKSFNFIMGFMADKDIKNSLSILNFNNNKFFFVRVKNNDRAIGQNELANIAQSVGICGKPCESLLDALKCIKLSKNDKYINVICGSLYLYKDFQEKPKKDC